MSKDKDTQLIWENYSEKNTVEENMYSDTIYKVDLETGYSQVMLMTDQIAESLAQLKGPVEGAGATVWTGERDMFLKPNK